MAAFSGLEHIVREQQPLAPLTWLRIGGVAEYFAEPTTIDELCQIVARCYQLEMPLRILGGGSRIVASERGVRGLVVQLTAPVFGEIHVASPTVSAGAGAKFGQLVSTSVREGLAGLESLVGIPGSVGGALRGNASSFGSSIGPWVTAVRVITAQGEIVARQRDQLRFSHGDSSLDDPVILDGVFALEPGDSGELTRRMQKAWIIKRTSQPSGNLGTGRLFKDPHGMGAAEVIEQAGLRGFTVGAARVADASANFVEVHPGATIEDVRRLIEQIRARVASALGVDLECELEMW